MRNKVLQLAMSMRNDWSVEEAAEIACLIIDNINTINVEKAYETLLDFQKQIQESVSVPSYSMPNRPLPLPGPRLNRTLRSSWSVTYDLSVIVKPQYLKAMMRNRWFTRRQCFKIIEYGYEYNSLPLINGNDFLLILRRKINRYNLSGIDEIKNREMAAAMRMLSNDNYFLQTVCDSLIRSNRNHMLYFLIRMFNRMHNEG